MAPETLKDQMKPRFPDWLAVAMLALVTLTVYWPATRSDFINFDDHYYVTSNLDVQRGLTWAGVKSAFVNVVSSNWHPVTMLSHMADCQIFGLNPWGHHLTSILLHSVNTVLVFVLLRILTGTFWRSLLVATFFGLHPLRVESVAWVAERKDVLSGFFGLLSLIFYARYAQTRSHETAPAAQTSSEPRRKWRAGAYSYGLAFGSLGLGLMSKPMLVTWPFVMFLMDYWPLQRLNRENFLRLLREKIPFFTLALASSVVTFIVQQRTGATNMVENFSLVARSENALISYVRYLEKMFWPHNLALLYPIPRDWPIFAVVCAGLLMVAATWLFWAQRQRYPFLLMGWLWYCGTLIPVIGLVQVGEQAMADRYTYLPSIGVLILVVWGACEIVNRTRFLQIPAMAGAAAGMLLCAGLTHAQIGYWRDSATLFRHTVQVTQSNYYAHYCLGNALGLNGNIDEAVSQLQEAVTLKPDFVAAHINLGDIFRKQGDVDQAISQYGEAVRLEPNNGGWHFDLGLALVKKHSLDEAIGQFREAVRLMPDAADCRTLFGLTLEAKGSLDEAISQFREAVRLKPDIAQFHNNLAVALENNGKTDEAAAEYQEALRLEGNKQ